MRSINDVQQDIEVTNILKSVAQTYEEIAVMQIQKIRTSVLTTRDFLKRVNEVYFEVKNNYKNKIINFVKRKKIEENKVTFSTLNKNGKNIKVLLTANEKLSGDISKRVFSLFYKDFLESKSDLIIIGKTGKELFDEKEISKRYKYFDLPKYSSSIQKIQPLVKSILKYETVEVYHGRLINLVTQIEQKVNLSGENAVQQETKQSSSDLEQKKDLEDKKDTSKKDENKKTDYLYEPSIKEVLHFFEVQIFGSLFKQSISESNLANLGSRIKSMEQAATNTEKTLGKLKIEENLVKKSLKNKKQLQRLAGITLWS